jgi:hypothetical protein
MRPGSLSCDDGRLVLQRSVSPRRSASSLIQKPSEAGGEH